ncbi:MAG: fumarylacetoacetate hydrolase family protein [Bacteroidales bacterium]|nr:fumarylacetoacetate hydrolase family protein [Bacteroidales bacterium]
MKIICIGRNYIDHAKELNNPVPKEPVFFMKPDTALLLKNQPFFYPEFSSDIHFETELVVRIKKVGKHIQEKFAPSYYDEVAVGIDFTARDLQQKCKEKGLPWEIAKSFDHAAPLSKFIAKTSFQDVQNIKLRLDKNGETVQLGNTKDMLFTVDQIIAYISQFITLKIGDLIYTGTPAGVGPVTIGDHLEAFLDDKLLLKVDIK